MRDVPQPVWNVPCPAPCRIGLDRFNPYYAEPEHGLPFFIASEYITATLTHWLDGRSQFCPGPTCAVSHDFQSPIWSAFLHIVTVNLEVGGWSHYWMRVTPGAAHRCTVLADPAFYVRGRQIKVRRVDRRYNARVEVRLTGTTRGDIPAAVDLRPFIVQLIEADNLAPEERERRRQRGA